MSKLPLIAGRTLNWIGMASPDGSTQQLLVRPLLETCNGNEPTETHRKCYIPGVTMGGGVPDPVAGLLVPGVAPKP